MSQECQGANFIWMGKNLNLLVSHVNVLCCVRLLLTGGGHVLTYTCARKHLPPVLLAGGGPWGSELTRLRPRIQDSSWMPWWEDVCFEGVSSPQHSLCVYQCWNYRDSSEAMWGRFQVVQVLTESCTMVRASVQRDEVLSNLIQPLLIAGGLD